MTRTSLLIGIALLLSACAPALRVNIDPEARILPAPVFSVARVNGEAPIYSRIRVFEDDGSCEVPRCSILWQADVSPDSSPKLLTYGKLPSIGAITVVPPRKLEVGKEYILMLDYGPSIPPTDEGTFTFMIDENAEAIASTKNN